MKLVFIRHGDPDYKKDSLTEKGWAEAKLLADRMESMEVKQFYCSPLGRARDTANVTLNRVNRTAITLDWLKEFFVPIKDVTTGKDRIPWDFMPEYWTKKPELYDKDSWYNSDIMKTGNVAQEYKRVSDGIDSILNEYGYKRNGNMYLTEKGNTDTIVFYCHLGVQFVILSHLLGISAPLLWQGFFVAPTSVTVLSSEERCKGEVYFRCKTLGDTSHLYIGNEPVSNSGFFQEIFEQK